MKKPTKRTTRRPVLQPPKAREVNQGGDVTAILLDRLRAEEYPPASALELVRKVLRDADESGNERPAEELRRLFEMRLTAAIARKGVRASMLDVSRRYKRDCRRFGRYQGDPLLSPAEENRRRKLQWAEGVARVLEETGGTLPFPLTATPEEQEAMFAAWDPYGFSDSPERA